MSPAKAIRNKEGAASKASQDPVRATFSRKERLRSKKSIEELFKSGSSLRYQPFLLKYLITNSGDSRVLIAVPKKFHKKAVARNLLKRRIREAYRLNKHLLLDYSLDMAFIYQSTEVMAFQDIQEKLINLMVRLRKKVPPRHGEQEIKNFSTNE